MPHRWVYGIGLMCLALIFTVNGCGGGGSGDDGEGSEYWVHFSEPTYGGTYLTDNDSVKISGSSFVPEGASCPALIGDMPPGYSVSWTNSANGSSGSASFYLNCLMQVFVVWETGASLEIGTNTFTVTATDVDGHVGQNSIDIIREADTTPPAVVSIVPENGAVDVHTYSNINITFSEDMDLDTLTGSTITLKDSDDNSVYSTVYPSEDATSVSINPFNNLAFNTAYTVTVTTAVKDNAGNALEAPFVASFTTGTNPYDETPPSVVAINPVNGNYCASPNTVVTAIFSEDIDPVTLNNTTFLLSGEGNQSVPGSVSSVEQNATFTPTGALPLATPFTATLTTGIKDYAGNALTAPYQWSFTITGGTLTGTWSPTDTANAPWRRIGHVAVWSGSEMIIAGGLALNPDVFQFEYTNQYGRYNPTTDSWVVATGAPTSASGQKAVWTGSKMLIFGGDHNGNPVTLGVIYDPVTDTWSNISTVNEPTARRYHTAVWTGSEMIVWGGHSHTYLGDGARYNPATDTWTPVSTVGAPSARYGHSAVWTGTEMIIWGGKNSTYLKDGARYDPVTDTWSPINSVDAPSVLDGHTAVWTGNRMIIWGTEKHGILKDGGIYDPETDTWQPIDDICAPSWRPYVTAVWTGSRMLIFGGYDYSHTFSEGAAYDPVENKWFYLSISDEPEPRYGHTGVWTGSKMIIWGGYGNGYLNSGGVFVP